jgi:hypothetical protein
MDKKRKRNEAPPDENALAKGARRALHGMRVASELSAGAGQEAFEYVLGHPPSLAGIEYVSPLIATPV